MHQHPRYRQSLLHPARQTIHQRIAFIRQVRQLQNVIDHLGPLRPVDVVSGREKFEVLLDDHVFVRPEIVGHVSDQRSDLARLIPDDEIADARLAPGWLE